MQSSIRSYRLRVSPTFATARPQVTDPTPPVHDAGVDPTGNGGPEFGHENESSGQATADLKIVAG